jgi:hypothetical protein
MIDAIEWLCSRKGDGGCEILVMEHEGHSLNYNSMFESWIL